MRFADGQVRLADFSLPFAELAIARLPRGCSWWDSGFYRTPGHSLGTRSAKLGRPFLLCLRRGLRSGHRHADRRKPGAARRPAARRRQSINPALDIGQIEGGFVQGMGWLTSEELHWRADGKLMTTRRPPTKSRPRSGCAGGVPRGAVRQRQPRSRQHPPQQGGGRAAVFMLALAVFLPCATRWPAATRRRSGATGRRQPRQRRLTRAARRSGACAG